MFVDLYSHTNTQTLLVTNSPPHHQHQQGHASTYIEETKKLYLFGGFDSEEMFDCFTEISLSSIKVSGRGERGKKKKSV